MKDREAVLLEIIHLMSEKLKDQIILKGGMLLKLLGSQRSTQDIDYILLSNKSKKILVDDIKRILEELEYLKIEDVQLNSRGIFITLSHVESSQLKAMLEISVIPALHMPSEHMSTVALSNKYSLGGRVVSTMALPEAFANKIAATLERDTIRDFYDISILEGLCDFDKATLIDRLNRLSIEREKPCKVSFQEAAKMLEEKVAKLTEAKINKELAPTLPAGQTEGIEMIIKSSVLRVAKKMSVL